LSGNEVSMLAGWPETSTLSCREPCSTQTTLCLTWLQTVCLTTRTRSPT
jgi:hypothetical protein